MQNYWAPKFHFKHNCTKLNEFYTNKTIVKLSLPQIFWVD